MERSTDSIGKNSKHSICDTETFLPSPESPCSNLITACDDSMRLQIQINDVSSKRASFVKYTRYASSELPKPQIQPNRKPTQNNTSALIDQIMLYPAKICSPQKVSSKRTPTTHETLLSPLSKKHTVRLDHHRLKNQLMLLSGKEVIISCESSFTRVKKYIQYTYNIFKNGFFKKPKKKSPKVTRQEFAIQCMAKSEFIAAGKLHYILSDVSPSIHVKVNEI